MISICFSPSGRIAGLWTRIGNSLGVLLRESVDEPAPVREGALAEPRDLTRRKGRFDTPALRQPESTWAGATASVCFLRFRRPENSPRPIAVPKRSMMTDSAGSRSGFSWPDSCVSRTRSVMYVRSFRTWSRPQVLCTKDKRSVNARSSSLRECSSVRNLRTVALIFAGVALQASAISAAVRRETKNRYTTR